MHAEKAHHKPPRINTCKPALRRTCKPAPRLHTMLQPCMQRKPKRPMMRMVHAASAGCCNGPGACPTCTKLQLPLQAASRWVVLLLLHCPAASLPRVSRCQRCKGCVTHTPKPSNHPHPTAPKHAHTQQPTQKYQTTSQRTRVAYQVQQPTTIIGQAWPTLASEPSTERF